MLPDKLLFLLDHPLARVVLRCRSEQPIDLTRGPGVRLVSDQLRRALLPALRAVGCRRDPPCEVDRRGVPACADPGCSLGLFLKPRNPVPGRDLAMPVRIASRDLERGAAQRFGIELSLLGERSIAQVDLLRSAVHHIGRTGLGRAGRDARFEVWQTELFEPASLGWLAGRLPAVDTARLTVETPCITSNKHDQTTTFRLADLAANAAIDLAHRACDEAAFGPAMGRVARDKLAVEARDRARAVVGQLELRDVRLREIDLGHRASSAGGRYPRVGTVGSVELRGDLVAAWPWLLNLEWAGAGMRRAMGFGRVSLMIPARALAYAPRR